MPPPARRLGVAPVASWNSAWNNVILRGQVPKSRRRLTVGTDSGDAEPVVGPNKCLDSYAAMLSRCSFRWSSYSCMAPGCLWMFLKFHGYSWIFGSFHLRCVWVRTESEVQRGCWCLQNCNFSGLTIRIPGVKLQIFGASLNMLYVYKLNWYVLYMLGEGISWCWLQKLLFIGM